MERLKFYFGGKFCFTILLAILLLYFFDKVFPKLNIEIGQFAWK